MPSPSRWFNFSQTPQRMDRLLLIGTVNLDARAGRGL